jgi:hypothetical protein
MLKGKSTIEMTDVHTGKKEIYRDENLVTEAIADILNTNIQGAMFNNPYFDGRRTETMNRIKELQDFITGQDTAITEFNEPDVRKLIQKITVYEDKFTVEFKSGISIDIAE